MSPNACATTSTWHDPTFGHERTTMTDQPSTQPGTGVEIPTTAKTTRRLTADRVTPRRPRIAFLGGGLAAYWDQFPDLLPRLQRAAQTIRERLTGLGAEV